MTNKILVATTLSETLFDIGKERVLVIYRMIVEKREFKRTGNMEAYDRVESLSDQELKDAFYHEVLDKVSRTVRDEILLADDLPQDILTEIANKNLNGIEIQGGNIYAYPTRIYDKRYVAKTLSDYLQIAAPRLEQILIGENRYEVISKQVDAEKSRQLREIISKDSKENPDNFR